MAYAHGSVVIVDDPYKRGRRPFLVVSNDTRPYFGDDYTLAVITTTEFSEAVQLNAGDITEGQLNMFPSFIKPWSLHEFNHNEIDRRVAHVSNEVLNNVADVVYSFIEPKD